MWKTLVLVAVLLLPQQAAAQQTVANAEQCLDVVVLQSEFRFKNKCDYTLNIEVMHADTKTLSEHTLSPGKEISFPRNIFGAACRTGHRSEIPVTLEYRKKFIAGAYRCTRK